MRKKREFIKIRKDELKQDEGAAASAQARACFCCHGTPCGDYIQRPAMFCMRPASACRPVTALVLTQQTTHAQVAVPAPDPALPPSFDPEGNTHRYRFLESNGGWIARCGQTLAQTRESTRPTGLNTTTRVTALT